MNPTDTTPAEALLPCPFCGCAVAYRKHYQIEHPENECLLSGLRFQLPDDPGQVESLWNARLKHQPDAVEKIREALEAMREEVDSEFMPQNQMAVAAYFNKRLDVMLKTIPPLALLPTLDATQLKATIVIYGGANDMRSKPMSTDEYSAKCDELAKKADSIGWNFHHLGVIGHPPRKRTLWQRLRLFWKLSQREERKRTNCECTRFDNIGTCLDCGRNDSLEFA